MILIASVEQDFRTFVSRKIELSLARKRIESLIEFSCFCSFTAMAAKLKKMYENHQ